MKFHLDHNPKISPFKIKHQDELVLIGSCFSDEIGNKLKDLRFNSISNPAGTLFSPLAIHNLLSESIQPKHNLSNFTIKRGEIFCNYHFHSDIHADNEKTLNEKIALLGRSILERIKQAKVLFLTFGSSWVYKHKQLNAYVANCHKQNSNSFEKEILNVSEISKRFLELIPEIHKLNPEIRIVFTVSPVKHLRDGVEENFLSKSVLRLAIDEIIKDSKNTSYFPAYELITDDLRDYRFYKEDLAHPNELAVNYVWEKFSQTYFDEKTIELNKKIHNLNVALAHSSMFRNKEEEEKQKAFIINLEKEIALLQI